MKDKWQLSHMIITLVRYGVDISLDNISLYGSEREMNRYTNVLDIYYVWRKYNSTHQI